MKAYVALLLSTLLWGLWGLAAKKAVDLSHPYSVLWMYSVPYMVALPFWYWMGARFAHAPDNNSGAFLWAAVASLASLLAMLILFFALRSKPASVAVAATSAYPLVTMALAVFTGSESFGVGRLAGVLLIVVGIVIIQL